MRWGRLLPQGYPVKGRSFNLDTQAQIWTPSSTEGWREYCHDRTAGRVGSYRQSPTYGNQSLKNFFELFRSTWKKPTPTPQPEKYGLVALQPEHLTQSQLIDELLRA
jgi:hypothetical protein